jgi:hypothetical protein
MIGVANSKIPTTQEHLDIEDIRDDLVVLKNGVVSIVLEVNALNFDLLSEQEQDVKIMHFAALLNSINFVFQIVVRTELTDTTEYIEKLRAYKHKQISDALKNQIDIYINFIENLTINKDVLDKTFYLIIPESPSIVEKTSFVKQLFGKKNKITNVKSIINYVKPRLTPKAENIIKQFKNIGLIAKILDTNSLIRLYYSMYDPDRTGNTRLQLATTEFTSGIVQTKITK